MWRRKWACSFLSSVRLNVGAYLDRIGYGATLATSPETLRDLHQQHLLSVPFENLDIHRGRRIEVDVDRFYEKIVTNRRGGFCYELNGLFAALLRQIGFDVDMLSGRVPTEGGDYGPEFDHMALLVRTDTSRWLADVGFGDCFLLPLDLDRRDEQQDPAGRFRILEDRGEWTLSRLEEGVWKPQYLFTLTPHDLSDYRPMCDYHQTSPESPFTRKRVCSLATLDGRITLRDQKLIVTRQGRREESGIQGQAEWLNSLQRHFGIDLSSEG